jgi:hypothetical protein
VSSQAVEPGTGDVVVAWYDRRLDPPNDALDVFFARAGRGGPFGPAERLTTESTVQGTASLLVGDYLNVAADAGRLHAAWTDKRAGEWDIFHAEIPRPVARDLGAGAPLPAPRVGPRRAAP